MMTHFTTLSDGSYLAPLYSFKRCETALRRAQRAMSRKTQFSNPKRRDSSTYCATRRPPLLSEGGCQAN